jgi:hypothetical protein
MNEFIESIRSILDTWGELAKIILNALSLFCIVAGVVITPVRGIQYRQRNGGDHPLHTCFRMIFGGWLVEYEQYPPIASGTPDPYIPPTVKSNGNAKQ